MAGGDKFRILVVEDEAFSRKLAGKLLSDLGAEHVAFARSGAEARAVIAEDPSLRMIFSDHYMADGNGIALLGDLRRGLTQLPHDVYFVVATSSTSSALASVALALDVDSFFTKPYNRDQLALRLHQFLTQPRAVKSVEHFRSLDVDAMLAAAEAHDPAAQVHAAQNAPMTPLAKILPGTALAADLIGADGAVLMKKGEVLTRHAVARLTELGIVLAPAARSDLAEAAELRRKMMTKT